jgi:hypothetical protein
VVCSHHLSVQAYAKEHQAAVRAAAANARLNTLQYDEPPQPRSPSTSARPAAADVNGDDAAGTQSAGREGKRSKSDSTKSKKRSRKRGRDRDEGEDDADAIERLRNGRSKRQWQLDEENFDRQCARPFSYVAPSESDDKPHCTLR